MENLDVNKEAAEDEYMEFEVYDPTQQQIENIISALTLVEVEAIENNTAVYDSDTPRFTMIDKMVITGADRKKLIKKLMELLLAE